MPTESGFRSVFHSIHSPYYDNYTLKHIYY